MKGNRIVSSRIGRHLEWKSDEVLERRDKVLRFGWTSRFEDDDSESRMWTR